MARTTVCGQAIVVTSTLKLEELKKVKKYRPEELILKDKKDEPVFVLDIGPSSLGTYGASFCEETRDEGKKAIMTIVTTYDGEDIKDYVVDKFGGALAHLNELEEKLPAVVAEIDRAIAKISEGITISQ